MKKFTLLIVLLLAFNFNYGQEIASFSSAQNVGCSGVIFNDANITATGVCRGPGININAGGTYNSRDWTTAATLDSNDYLEWTLTPNPGYEINLTTMDMRYDRSPSGPTMVDIQVDTGSGYSSIFTDASVSASSENNDSIDLTSISGVASTITFRLYAFNATSTVGTLDIEQRLVTSKGIIINGTASVIVCPTSTTWNGTWSNGLPNNLTKSVIINSDYNTSSGDIIACSLTVDASATLTVGNGGFIEVENDVTVDGTLVVETQGNFVQNDNAGIFTNNGVSRVNKQTPAKADWFYYTYWSSPVINESIGDAFPNVDGDRRYSFNGANFLDTDGDDIDDDDNAWQSVFDGDSMTPGLGYASTESRFHFPGATGLASFEGPFNTGDVSVGISNNPANVIASWNFIGNPYPSAIDFDAFHAANSTVVDGAAYFWSQATPHAESNPGNEQSNFSTNDYATYTVGSGGVAGGSPVIPTQYIPSGQGFFIAGIDNNPVTFTNAMRMADGTSNTQFFRNSSSKNKTVNATSNRLWVNLTTESGLFSQVLLAYVEGATDNNDGLSFDAPKIVSQDFAAILYSSMASDDKKYVIQGKNIDSINEDEIINLGFSTTIEASTDYKLSIAQFEGDFLTSSTVYVKDNLENALHNLSDSDYTFTSEVGEFNDRFEIVFNANSLSTEDIETDSNTLKIVELENNNVQFTTSKAIKTVKIFDLLGRQLYNLKGQTNSETYKLSRLSSSIYIAKVQLSDGTIITKKAFKK